MSFVDPLLLTLPVVVAMLTSGWAVGRWVALVAGTLYGLGLVTLGVLLGGMRIDRRAPELLGQLATAQI